MRIRATPLGRLELPAQSPSKKYRRKYYPKGRKTTRLPKIFILAAACIKAGEMGITKSEALKISGYKENCHLDNVLMSAAEREFLFWEYDPAGDTDRRTSKGRGMPYSGRIGILSYPTPKRCKELKAMAGRLLVNFFADSKWTDKDAEIEYNSLNEIINFCNGIGCNHV